MRLPAGLQGREGGPASPAGRARGAVRAGARVGPGQVRLRWRGGALPEDSPLTRTPRAQGDPAGRPSVFQVCGRRGVGGRRMLRSRGLRAGAGWTGRSRSAPPPPPAVAPRLPRGECVCVPGPDELESRSEVPACHCSLMPCQHQLNCFSL